MGNAPNKKHLYKCESCSAALCTLSLAYGAPRSQKWCLAQAAALSQAQGRGFVEKFL